MSGVSTGDEGYPGCMSDVSTAWIVLPVQDSLREAAAGLYFERCSRDARLFFGRYNRPVCIAIA